MAYTVRPSFRPFKKINSFTLSKQLVTNLKQRPICLHCIGCYRQISRLLKNNAKKLKTFAEVSFPSSPVVRRCLTLVGSLETSASFCALSLTETPATDVLLTNQTVSCGNSIDYSQIFSSLSRPAFTMRAFDFGLGKSTDTHNNNNSSESCNESQCRSQTQQLTPDGGGSNDAYPVALLSAAATTCLLDEDEEKWKHEQRVTDEEIERVVDELQQQLDRHTSESSPCSPAKAGGEGSWQLEWESPSVSIYSRPIPGKDFMQYKVHGHYEDIPPIAFFYIQTNISHRKDWDINTDTIEMIGKGEGNSEDTEFIYWRVNFPRLMSKRDYVFARRQLVDLDREVMVTTSRAFECSDKPVDQKFVRVTDYVSKMLVKPRGTMTQNGFDYVMIYIDDTKTKMPAYALKKLVRNALPPFLETVHQESKSVMAEYLKLKDSGADIAACKDSRVRELHEMIERAKAKQHYNNLKQSLPVESKQKGKGTRVEDEKTPDEVGGRNSTTPGPSVTETDRPVLIRKIRPPEYLPDWRKYIEMLFVEKRLTPIPFKQVHDTSAGSRSGSRKH